MKYTPLKIGLLQAVALSLYIGFFAVSVFKMQNWIYTTGVTAHPIVGILIFLFAFVISALISGSIIFAYPVTLFFDGHKREALGIVFWSAVWLIIIFAIVSVSIFFAGLGIVK